MISQVSELLQGVIYGVAGITAAVVVIANLSRGPNLDMIPTVGPSTRLGFWWAGFKNLSNAADVLQEGYDKYKSGLFKYAEQYRWMVIVSKREHIEELGRAPDEVLSFEEASIEQFDSKYTLEAEDSDARDLAAVVRSQLTRNLRTLYPEIRDEIVTAFNDVLDLKDKEWKSVPALHAVQQVVCRTSNRLFVGLPLCRDPDWVDLSIQYTIDVTKAASAMGLFPKFIKPLVVHFLTSTVRRGRVRGVKLLGPIIEQRLKYLHEYGSEWDGKPNDLISWFMEELDTSQLTVKTLVRCVMTTNFAAIHTSSNSFTSALFYLAANPQYIRLLREEVETVTEKEGWSKESLEKMHKIDSLLRECQRIEGNSSVSLTRKALKDFTFSDGTFIPKGTLVGVASRCLHYDETFYKKANVFEPFRFADMRKGDGVGVKYQFVSTGPEYLPFGHGRHACPGRFFTANELKSMLAHVVITYDIKLEGDATRPRNQPYGTANAANPNGRVLFRKRVD